jgi:hypothetical protein
MKVVCVNPGDHLGILISSHPLHLGDTDIEGEVMEKTKLFHRGIAFLWLGYVI